MSTKLPHFETEEQIREFWADHDSTEYFDELEELPEGVTMLSPRTTIVLRLDKATIERLEKLAAIRNTEYHALLQTWLMERLQKEEKAATSGMSPY
jgi:hypothetical protein